MGYQTTIMVLNDRWYEAMQNPYQFVESIEETMRQGVGGEAVFQTAVCQSHHASDKGLYMSHGNRMFDLTGHPDGPNGFDINWLNLATQQLEAVRRLRFRGVK